MFEVVDQYDYNWYCTSPANYSLNVATRGFDLLGLWLDYVDCRMHVLEVAERGKCQWLTETRLQVPCFL